MVSGEAVLRELFLMSRFLCHGNEKKHNYEAKICEFKHATCTLTYLVFSSTEGMADEACDFANINWLLVKSVVIIHILSNV